MTFKVKREKCKSCGNVALLLSENNGLCLKCKFPVRTKREPVEGSFIEGCGCELCKKHLDLFK
jgi:hypothetical protein